LDARASQAIINRPGFHFGWALGLLEMLGTCIFSAIERYMSPPNGTPTSSNSGTNVLITKIDYVIVAVCLMASSSLSNIALNYINFPTKVRLAKLCGVASTDLEPLRII